MKRLLPIVLLAACAESAPELGTVELALSDAAFFRLRIFANAGAVDPSDDGVFDTGCLERRSRTYELSNIPVGTGYAVLYEGFSAATCDAASQLEVGYRGDVAITKGQQPYYHVPVYPTGGVAALPENINVSASLAEPISFCESDDACALGSICYDAAAPQYYCVPTCVADADCGSLHPRATCDVGNGWCMLLSPYPLNLSEERSFGAAATLANGDVVFVGGLRPEADGFGPTTHWLERFDARTGLLAAAEVEGADALPAGLFGFAQLDANRFVAVGGVDHLDGIHWDPNDGLEPEAEWTSVVSKSVVVFEPSTGRATSTTLPQGVVEPTVVRLDVNKFIILGGRVATGGGLEPTKKTTICVTGSDLVPTCSPGPDLTTARFAAAAACTEASCSVVLVVGGNIGESNLGELVEVGGGSTALTTAGIGDKVFYPKLCGLNLVGGSQKASSAEPFTPVRLSVEGTTLTAEPIDGAAPSVYLGAVASGSGCFVGGGFDDVGLAQSDVHTLRDGTFVTIPDASFGQARAGAMAATIGAGPLAGRVIFGGGFAVPPGGDEAVLVRGLEVLTP